MGYIMPHLTLIRVIFAVTFVKLVLLFAEKVGRSEKCDPFCSIYLEKRNEIFIAVPVRLPHKASEN